MKEFIRNILNAALKGVTDFNADELFENSPLLKYLNLKTGAIFGNTKTRRSLANIYAIYSILHFYVNDFFQDPQAYKKFEGYDYTKLFLFYRGLYGGDKIQNHALNSRVNGEFKNKITPQNGNDLIIINNGKYALHIDYLYFGEMDISRIAVQIIEKYISLLSEKDNKLISDITILTASEYVEQKRVKLRDLLNEQAEARIFEIISFAILKNHYKSIKIFFGYSRDDLQEHYLTLYKTGRTNANDGGIDFVMSPIGRFFQVTEVSDSYNKYFLDIDKVAKFPITFVVKTLQSKETVLRQLHEYAEIKSDGMEIIRNRYLEAIEEIITINELTLWLGELNDTTINELLKDIILYYRLELNLPLEQDEETE